MAVTALNVQQEKESKKITSELTLRIRDVIVETRQFPKFA